MSNISVDYDILNQKQTPAFYASSLATRPAFGFPGRIFIDTDTPSSGIYRDTGSAWVQVADPGAGTTGTLQQVTTNGNTTTLGIVVQGININSGAGTGLFNTAIGNNSLNANTTGQYNTAIGSLSLQANTTGIDNTAIGSQSLQANTTGNLNTAIGFQSLVLNTTGSNNTTLGSQALKENTTASFNTAIGSNSLQNNTTASFNTAIGYNSLQANTNGTNNTAIGYNSLLNNINNDNTAIGVNSLLSNTSGTSNTAIGLNSLFTNTTGSYNIAIGKYALNGSTTASNNTAIGYNSLQANTTGNNNTAIGLNSLKSNRTGLYNVAIGVASLDANTTGVNNTAVGYSALQLLTIGGGNVAVGYGSGSAITTGNNNYLLGGGQAITTGSNNTIIGSYGGSSALSNYIVLSDGQSNVRLFSNDTGKVGINVPITDTPTGQVDIHTSLTNALVLNGNTTNNAYLGFASAGVNKWRIGSTYNAGANSFDIYNIGTSTTALSFNSTTNAASFSASITMQSGNGVKFNRSANDYYWQINNDSNNYLNFGTYLANGTDYLTNPKIILLDNGNIGIGTATPTSSANYTSLVINGTTGSEIYLRGGNVDYGYMYANSSGVVLATQTSIPLTFQTNATSRMRIVGSNGNVLIGSTTDDTTNKLQVTGSTKLNGLFFVNHSTASNYAAALYNTSATGEGLIVRGGSTASHNSIVVQPYDGSVALFSVLATGVATFSNLAGTGSRAVLADASGTLSAPVSDISVKQNINTIGYGLNEVLKMNPVWFDYIDEYKKYGEGRQNGNIAQEMETIIPEAVFTTPSTGKMGINYDQLHAVYIKAIQELNEKVNRLYVNHYGQ